MRGRRGDWWMYSRARAADSGRRSKRRSTYSPPLDIRHFSCSIRACCSVWGCTSCGCGDTCCRRRRRRQHDRSDRHSARSGLPPENASLQEEIYRRHLLISPFRVGERISKSNFPKRNRVMAAITDATVIIEASDTSGALHQVAECVRLGRWLFIAKSLADNPSIAWPAKFLQSGGRTEILTSTDHLVRAVLSEHSRRCCWRGDAEVIRTATAARRPASCDPPSWHRCS